MFTFGDLACMFLAGCCLSLILYVCLCIHIREVNSAGGCVTFLVNGDCFLEIVTFLCNSEVDYLHRKLHDLPKQFNGFVVRFL